MHPCSGKHSIVLRAFGGGSTKPALANFDQNLHGVDPDLIMVEYAVNDGFLGKPQRGDPTFGMTVLDQQQWNTEALIRRLLRYRANSSTRPTPAAVLYVESGYRGGPWLDPTYGLSQDSFNQGLAAWSHWPLLQYYGVPTVSFADIIAPIQLRMRECRSVPASNFTASEKRWGCGHSSPVWGGTDMSFFTIHTDKCCHPFIAGHTMIAYLVAYTFELELAVMDTDDAPRANWAFEQDPSMDGDGSISETKLPALLRMAPMDDVLYANSPTLISRDFSNQQADTAADVVAAPHWSVMTDSKDKFGLISTTPFAHVAVDISFDSSEHRRLVQTRSEYEAAALRTHGKRPQSVHSSLKVSVVVLETYQDISAVSSFGSDWWASIAERWRPLTSCDLRDIYVGCLGRRWRVGSTHRPLSVLTRDQMVSLSSGGVCAAGVGVLTSRPACGQVCALSRLRPSATRTRIRGAPSTLSRKALVHRF
jgi:hypothetical protein